MPSLYLRLLAVVGGVPALIFSDGDPYGLRSIEAVDDLGSAWGSPEELTYGALGLHATLTDVAGEPVIACPMVADAAIDGFTSQIVVISRQ